MIRIKHQLEKCIKYLDQYVENISRWIEFQFFLKNIRVECKSL